MDILVINAGSSSLKYQLISMENEAVLAKGVCERIGIGGKFTHKTADGRTLSLDVEMKNHRDAFFQVARALTEGEYKVLDDISQIYAIGHRIVQGGDIFKGSVLVNEKVINDIEGLAALAPLHNKAHVQGIRACIEVFGPKVPQVVVFDTAFHQTMPERAFLFGVDYKYYKEDHVRKYGFHGTSHRYVSQRCAELMGKRVEELKIVTCHLGNGSSICAVDAGKSIDTSMGFTPLDGLMMGTRSGAVDPSAITFIMDKYNIAPRDMDELLNKKSGMVALSGVSSDERDLTAANQAGDVRAAIAQDMQRYQVKRYIGAYAAAMNGLDAVVFTGGIGENGPRFRETVCKDMDFFGIAIDPEKNEVMIHGKEGDISASCARVHTFVIPTNEELVIARDTKEIVEKLK